MATIVSEQGLFNGGYVLCILSWIISAIIAISLAIAIGDKAGYLEHTKRFDNNNTPTVFIGTMLRCFVFSGIAMSFLLVAKRNLFLPILFVLQLTLSYLMYLLSKKYYNKKQPPFLPPNKTSA